MTPGPGGDEEDDVLDPNNCSMVDERSCMDACLLEQFDDPKNFSRPYSLFTNNCYHWRSCAFDECAKRCQ